MIYISIIISGIISNKIAKPLFTNIKMGKNITNYFCIVDSCILRTL